MENKCDCIACKLAEGLANKSVQRVIKIDPSKGFQNFADQIESALKEAMTKSEKIENFVVPFPNALFVANRDIKAGELVTGDDVSLPTVEQVKAYHDQKDKEAEQDNIDRIWCEMTNSQVPPTELDRKTDAWHHAKNLFKKNVRIAS